VMRRGGVVSPASGPKRQTLFKNGIGGRWKVLTQHPGW
jgi:hypothetical protein